MEYRSVIKIRRLCKGIIKKLRFRGQSDYRMNRVFTLNFSTGHSDLCNYENPYFKIVFSQVFYVT